jgi:hypothetical protein
VQSKSAASDSSVFATTGIYSWIIFKQRNIFTQIAHEWQKQQHLSENTFFTVSSLILLWPQKEKCNLEDYSFWSNIIYISVKKLILSLKNIQPGWMARKVSVSHITEISQKGKWQCKVHVVNKSTMLCILLVSRGVDP